MTPADEPKSDETPAPAHYTSEESAHPDPITGEAGAHPIGVGLGAIGAGLAGAAIGMVAGPVGAAIGAAIGAVAGGLAGKEVAAADDEPLPADADPLPSAAGLSGFDSAGVPIANLTASPEENVAGSNIDDPRGITAGQFHDAFTATTLHETKAENRLFDEGDPSEVPASDGVAGTSALGGTASGPTSERTEHVRNAAYLRYLDRQRESASGDELGDWLAAEQDISPKN